MKILMLLLLLAAVAPAEGDKGVILSRYVASDFDLTADPNAPHWKNAPGVFMEKGPRGEPAPGHRTEVRSLWSDKNLYFLFVCPYRALHLKPDPSTATETNKLLEWDVAEVFVGADFQNIGQYKEFQVSPQGEWVDLDIDVNHPKPEGGWRWNSGFKVKAWLDEASKVWYGEMQIPISTIDTRPPKAGNEMRINLYRIQGPPPERTLIAWQPTGKPNYHVPEAFGRLRLAPPAR